MCRHLVQQAVKKKKKICLFLAPTSAFTRWTSAISGFRTRSIGRFSTVFLGTQHNVRGCKKKRIKKKKGRKPTRLECVNDALMKCWTAVKVLHWVPARRRTAITDRASSSELHSSVQSFFFNSPVLPIYRSRQHC